MNLKLLLLWLVFSLLSFSFVAALEFFEDIVSGAKKEKIVKRNTIRKKIRKRQLIMDFSGIYNIELEITERQCRF